MVIKAGQLKGNILLASSWLSGEVSWDSQGKITEVNGSKIEEPNKDEPRIVAGFIDLHVHGGKGADSMGGEDQVRRLASFHAQNGTVALAPTTMTAMRDDVSHALSGIEEVRVKALDNEAEVLGAHLEGPFISPKRLGAQPDHALEYDASLVEKWLGLAKIPIATIAPEINGGMDLLNRLIKNGCKVQIGHSDANEKFAKEALDAGASGFTHLFNAMSGVNHRNGGVASCALAHAEYAEIICDLQHVEQTSIEIAMRAIPNLYAITDSTSAAGEVDGTYLLGTSKVIKEGNSVKTEQGALAGTAMTMFEARKNLLQIGVDEIIVQQMIASRPAEYLGLNHLGKICKGYSASIVLIKNNEVADVWINGNQL